MVDGLLTDKEMKVILAGTNVEALVGAGTQGRLDSAVDMELLQTNIPAAKEAVVEAAALERFESYETALKMCIVRALESVGYSKYAARVAACGNASGVVAWHLSTLPYRNTNSTSFRPSAKQWFMALRRFGKRKAASAFLVQRPPALKNLLVPAI